jgi:ABC-type lipoprotein release transport system permease subunit
LARNAGKTIPLVAVVMLAVMLIMGIVGMINSIPYSIRDIYRYSRESVAVSPRGDPSMTPKIVAQIKKSPHPIEKLILCRASGSQVNSIVGKWPFVMLGMERAEMDYYLKRLGVTKIDGRMPDETKPEALISEPVARNLKLKIGSVIQGPETQESYSPQKVKVVGIAKSDQWIMINGFAYQAANHFPPIDNVLAFAPSLAQQPALDRWVREEFKGERAQVFAYHILDKQTEDMFSILYRILDVVIGTLVLVITFMMGMLMNIYQSQRLVEFGLLQAIGFTKRGLLKRVLAETGIVLILGWTCGIGAAILMLKIAKATLMEPNAFALDTFDLVAFRYTIPVPLAIGVVAFFTVAARFKKFDPVGVVERRLV